MPDYLGHEFLKGRCAVCGALEKSVRAFGTACSGPRSKPSNRQEPEPAVIVVTTQVVPGRVIKEALGVVNGTAIMGANVIRDIAAGFRDMVGGRVSEYETKLREGRETALNEMRSEAVEMGADAVVAVAFSYEFLGANGSAMMVCASGTAVRCEANVTIHSQECSTLTKPATPPIS